MDEATSVPSTHHPAFDDWRARFSAGQEVQPPFGQNHDHEPLELSAAELVERLRVPAIGSKGSAGYFLASEFQTGKRAKGTNVGTPAFVVIDLDTGDFDADSIRLALDGVAHIAYSTASHRVVTDSNPKEAARWRVLIPLVVPKLTAEEHKRLARWIHRDVLGEDPQQGPSGVDGGQADHCGERLTQPMFWPTIESEEQPFEVLDSLDFAPLPPDDMERMILEIKAEDEARESIRAEAKRRRSKAGGDVITAYNEAHSVEELFGKYGYAKSRGGKWVHPHSTSGKPSEVIFKDADRWYSHRGSSEGTDWQHGDAFDLFRLFEHDGDAKDAVKAAAAELGIEIKRPGAEFFDRDHGFIPERMGNYLSNETTIVVGEGKRLYRYANGVYRPDAEDWIASRVRETLGERFKKRHRDETLAWFLSAMEVDTTTIPTDVVNVANGLLRLATLEVEAHSADLITTVQLPVKWNPKAECPRILAFLRDVLPDEETVEFVLEVIGYTLFPENRFHYAVLLRGPGRNGKSTILRILNALLGPDAVAAVPLQQFSENRFAPASLVGKLANICGDIDARAIKRTDVFKMLTGGDPIHTERKYGQAFTFTSFAVPIFSANEPPMSADQSEAWFERWLVVPMDKTIPPEKRDGTLGDRLTAPGELEGLLVLAVQALRRLLERGCFELPASIQAAQAEYRERLDSVSSFIESEIRFGPMGRVTRKELATAYKAHCRDLELHAVGAARLYERVRAADPGVSETASGGVRGFVGVSLR